MATPKSLVAALGALAVLGAGAAGWLLLRGNPAPVGPGVSRPEAIDHPDGGGRVEIPVRTPEGTAGGVQVIDDDDDRDGPDLDAPVGGASADDILFAGKKGDWKEVERLIAISGSDDPRVTQMLLDAMKDGHLRNWAARLAVHLKDPAALARFLELAKSTADDATRCAAIEASANIGGPGVFEAAAEILKTAKPGGMLFSSAVQALGTLGTAEAARALVDLLRASPGGPAHPVVVQALSQVHNPEALAEIGRMANDEGMDAGLRETLVAALGQTRDPAVLSDLLKAAREGSSEGIRSAAYLGIALVGEPQGVQELVNLLQGGDDGKKAAAALALQSVRSPAAGPILVAALGGPMPDQLRSYIVESLGYCGGKAALEPLSKLVADKVENSEPMRVVAVRALGRIGDPSSGKAIMDSVDAAPRTEGAYRREAINALSNTATVEELPRLERMLEGLTTNEAEYYQVRPIVDRLRREKGAKK